QMCAGYNGVKNATASIPAYRPTLSPAPGPTTLILAPTVTEQQINVPASLAAAPPASAGAVPVAPQPTPSVQPSDGQISNGEALGARPVSGPAVGSSAPAGSSVVPEAAVCAEPEAVPPMSNPSIGPVAEVPTTSAPARPASPSARRRPRFSNPLHEA